MRIPLPKMLRAWRQKHYESKRSGALGRWMLGAWAALARRPKLYRRMMGLGVAILGQMGRRHGRFRRLPFAGGWTGGRDLPAPNGDTFVAQWHRGARGDASGDWLRKNPP